MPILEPIILLGGCFICTALGVIGASLWYRPKLKRHHTEAWNAARIFYTRANEQQRESKI
jgi:hypothetical protein